MNSKTDNLIKIDRVNVIPTYYKMLRFIIIFSYVLKFKFWPFLGN